jgi:ATP-dependent RNA helicase DeaD
MRMFREGKLQILIATDIAARGIDVKGVDAVINYDVPKNMDYYIHRIGRTARAQMTGSAYTLISSDIHGNIRDIERVTKEKLNEHKVEGYVKSEGQPDYHDRPRFEPRQRDNRRGDGERRPFTRERREGDFKKPVHNKTPGATRMFITVGTMDNVDSHALKDFLIKDIGLSATDVTDVYTKDRFSFIEVKDEAVNKVLDIKSVNGRDVHVSIAKERSKDGGGDRRSGGYRNGGGRPQRGGFGKPRSFGHGSSNGGSHFGGHRKPETHNRGSENFGNRFSNDDGEHRSFKPRGSYNKPHRDFTKK